MQIVTMEIRHLYDLAKAPKTQLRMDYLEAGLYEHMLRARHRYALVNEKGIACAVGGISKIWEKRFIAWMLFATEKPAHFLMVHKAVARFLDSQTDGRIEALVDADFPQGHRWIKMLGFKKESERMRKFYPDGTDAYLYAKVV